MLPVSAKSLFRYNPFVVDRKKRTSSIVQRIRVPLGFLFGVIFLVITQPTLKVLVPGLILGSCGLMIRVWAAGHLRKHQELTVSGPYRWTRNPLYLGSMIMGSGLCIASGTYWLILLFIPLFLGIYLPVMKKEEHELSRSAGNDYQEYKSRVPLLFPMFPSKIPSKKIDFSWSWFMFNREYNAVIGFLIISIYLSIRIYWP